MGEKKEFKTKRITFGEFRKQYFTGFNLIKNFKYHRGWKMQYKPVRSQNFVVSHYFEIYKIDDKKNNESKIFVVNNGVLAIDAPLDAKGVLITTPEIVEDIKTYEPLNLVYDILYNEFTKDNYTI